MSIPKVGSSLVKAAGNDKVLNVIYDENGLRAMKDVVGVVHNYLYAGGKLLRETYGDTVLDFFYDANGTAYAFKYNGTVYYYVTNLQGDVLRIVDTSGNVVATYQYDPYGKVISATGNLAEINPLRYRGYYYDSETGFYYLQSRYYDPTICRFINADSYVSTGQGIIGCNMFAYCGNNPANYQDNGGDIPQPTLWEFYFIHRRVQELIVLAYGYAMEVFVTSPWGNGRLDLYNAANNQYYEVKSRGQYDTSPTSHLSEQMAKYDDSKIQSWIFESYDIPESPKRGTNSTISGSFRWGDWLVTYQYEENGVIIYDCRLKMQPDYQFEPDPVVSGAVISVAAACALYSFGGKFLRKCCE